MPLQNRVDPFGALHAVAERGSLMGNRGTIHDPRTRTLLRRRWTTKAWIICRCEFGNRKRSVMGYGSYTELFFLDEATALAAGHRPCFECQRRRAASFAAAFAAACGRTSIGAPEMDAILHRQRLAAGNEPEQLSAGRLRSLPDGSMIGLGGKAFLVEGGGVRPWAFGGYGRPVRFDELRGLPVSQLTPEATVGALRAGYRAEAAAASTA